MRKLASIRRIESIAPIDGADAIEVATVDGWKVVVRKGEYAPGDIAIYCEVDSWIPTELAPFLSKGKAPREYNGVKGERLRTVTLRGQLSQGLLLPFTAEQGIRLGAGPGARFEDYLGRDVTEFLGIQKWEAPIPAQLAGQVRGNFPSLVPKTDQERLQNLTKEFAAWKASPMTWEITEKLNGSSATMYLDPEDDFHVCSRNLDLARDENNSFWAVALRYGVEEKMRAAGLKGYAIQGELIGEGIQGNPYQLKGQDFFVFDVYDVALGRHVSPVTRYMVTKMVGLKHVPVLNGAHHLKRDDTIEFLLKYAEDVSLLNFKTEREGLVFKSNSQDVSFKVISNNFLLGEK